jgi:membrane protein
VLALTIWVLSSFFLRIYLGNSIGGGSRSIYGPLAAPIVVLIWLYFLAIAVLIGAALNAAMRTMWPVEERLSSRARLLGWLRGEVVRRREAGHERPLTPMPDPSATPVRKNPPAPPKPARREADGAPAVVPGEHHEESVRGADERSWSA